MAARLWGDTLEWKGSASCILKSIGDHSSVFNVFFSLGLAIATWVGLNTKSYANLQMRIRVWVDQSPITSRLVQTAYRRDSENLDFHTLHSWQHQFFILPNCTVSCWVFLSFLLRRASQPSLNYKSCTWPISKVWQTVVIFKSSGRHYLRNLHEWWQKKNY